VPTQGGETWPLQVPIGRATAKRRGGRILKLAGTKALPIGRATAKPRGGRILKLAGIKALRTGRVTARLPGVRSLRLAGTKPRRSAAGHNSEKNPPAWIADPLNSVRIGVLLEAMSGEARPRISATGDGKACHLPAPAKAGAVRVPQLAEEG